MRLKCILINPWIYDFSALNLWSRPLGLLKVAEYLSQYNVALGLIDCTDVIRKEKRFGTGKYPRQIVEKPEMLQSVPKNFARYGMDMHAFQESFKNKLPCDVVFITSIMSYWYPGVQHAIALVKSISPHTPVILGGIYATLFHRHARENSGADYVFKGHISDSCRPSVPLYSPHAGEKLKRDNASHSMENILENVGIQLQRDAMPRPYYELGLYKEYPFAPLLTGLGCPYKCSYCASSMLFNGFLQRDPDRIIEEIFDLNDRGVEDYAFYDDALLVNADSHLKVILREIKGSDRRIRFHCPNGIHARFLDDELAYLMKQSGFTTVRLSLETVDPERQSKTGGKVTSDNLRSAVQNLRKNGFTKEHIGVYLMYGLPGQHVEEIREGVEFLKSLEVRIHLTEFSPIPGTPCWEELKDKGIITDTIDPLLTNNSVFFHLYSGYRPDDLEKIRLDVKYYNSIF